MQAEGRNYFVVPPWLSPHVAMQALVNRQTTVAAMITELCRQILLSAMQISSCRSLVTPLFGIRPGQRVYSILQQVACVVNWPLVIKPISLQETGASTFALQKWKC